MSDAESGGLLDIRIPMMEAVESLNVAMAGTVILFEALRQRLKSAPQSNPRYD